MQAITLLHALKNNLSDLTLKYPFAYNPVGPDHSLPSTWSDSVSDMSGQPIFLF